MAVAAHIHRGAGAPFAAGGIIEFRAGKRVVGRVIAAGDQHFSAWQQRGRVRIAGNVQRIDDRPGPAGWIIEFRARNAGIAAVSARHQHGSIRQQRRRVIGAGEMRVYIFHKPTNFPI